jgi:crossover junction endodeoxyribonuclease RuvC
MKLLGLLGGRSGPSRAEREAALLARRAPLVILGLDPGLGTTGWGAIVREGNRLSHIDNGEIDTDPAEPLANRLLIIADGLRRVLEDIKPGAVAIEEVFVNKNAQSTLKLGQARGAALVAAAAAGVPITEYAARLVKKSVVGTGGAAKEQVQAMLRTLMPGLKLAGPDAADALAVAITHAHHG